MSGQKKLTDKQEKKIIARYAEGKTHREIAQEFGVCATTVRNVIKRNPESVQMCERKKEENTLDMFKYMDSRRDDNQDLLDRMREVLRDPVKLARASYRDIALAYGIIWDKSTQGAPKASDEYLQKAREILGGIDGAIK